MVPGPPRGSEAPTPRAAGARGPHVPGTGLRAVSLVARVTTTVGRSRPSLRRWLGLQAPAAVTDTASRSFYSVLNPNLRPFEVRTV